ncbi:MAG: DUF3467 domain-containing protein [Chloroflexi bacterium]|nr:DUF3467 domain-containing protein [Chloroflexota bacterium]
MEEKKRTVVTKGRPVPLKWTGVDDVPVNFANNILIQHTDHEFIVTFGYIQPPIVLTESDADSINSVACLAVARIAVSPTRMPEILRALSENYEKYRERMKESTEDTEEE